MIEASGVTVARQVAVRANAENDNIAVTASATRTVRVAIMDAYLGETTSGATRIGNHGDISLETQNDRPQQRQR